MICDRIDICGMVSLKVVRCVFIMFWNSCDVMLKCVMILMMFFFGVVIVNCFVF